MEGLSKWRSLVPMPEFSTDEYRERRRRAAKFMEANGIDAILLNSEANNRYFSGHTTGRWLNRTRPIFLIITRDGAGTILCSTQSEADTALMSTGGGCDIKVFGGTGHDLNPGINALVEELKSLGVDKGRVVAELGIHHRPQLPPLAFDWLRAALPSMSLEDGSDLLWRVRSIKSSAEVDYVKAAIAVAHRMYDRVPEWVASARTEGDVYDRVGMELLNHGADSVGYRCITTVGEPWAGWHTHRPVRQDSLIFIDSCCSVGGYWSDFCRVFAVSRPTDEEEDTYKKLWDITSEEIAAVRPGMTIRELHAATSRATEKLTGTTPILGRVGHSTGLEIVEPPSICEEQDWVIETGMVLCIEPSLALPKGGSLVAEEMIVVRDNGAEILTKRAPERIPHAANA